MPDKAKAKVKARPSIIEMTELKANKFGLNESVIIESEEE